MPYGGAAGNGAYGSMESGFYYGAPAASLSGGSSGSGALQATPIILNHEQTFDRIAIECTVTAAGSAIRLGVYNDDNGPAGLAFEAGTVDTSASTGILTVTINQTLGPGIFWLAGLIEGGTPSFRRVTSVASSYTPHEVFDSLRSGFFRTNVTTGALPATWSGGTTAGAAGPALRVMLRAA